VTKVYCPLAVRLVFQLSEKAIARIVSFVHTQTETGEVESEPVVQVRLGLLPSVVTQSVAPSVL